MNRLLLVALLAALRLFALTDSLEAQTVEKEFGVLQVPGTAHPQAQIAPAPTPAPLPSGLEPAQPSATTNPYPLTPTAGPWLICAATYQGPDGFDLALQVAQQLRQEHRMTTYIYNRGDEERKAQQQEWEALKKRYPGVPLRKRTYRVVDQYAVMVGDFKDLAAASSYLSRVKKLPLPKLKLPGDRSPYEVVTYQEPNPGQKEPVIKRAYVNPFHNAMVVRNPLAPAAQTNKPKWDPFWKQLNANEEYSLLRNPKPWTLVVKEYMGARTLQPRESSSSFLSALGFGNSRGEALDACAAQAHELARFLRHQGLGLESWVLHTRYSSVVTVGGFDSPDDPELQTARQKIARLSFKSQNGGGDPIGLLPQPIPVEVPRP
jgi:hypothetical protein